jgi:membrane protein
VIVGFRGAFSGFFANQGFFLAAGLSFYFLICIIPLLFLAISVLGFVLSREAAAAAVVEQLTQNFPVYRKETARVLLRVAATRTVSGLLGTVILILFSTQLFSAIRLVLARLFGSRPATGFLRGMLVDMLLVFAIGPLFIASIVASDLFGWFKALLITSRQVPGAWVDYSSVVFGVLLSAAMFYLIYRFLPNRRVRWGSALAGALLTSGLWELAKQLFRFYIRRFDVYDQIYGPLGVLVAFVMFVYYTMIVFVLGAAYVAALETRRR